MEGSPVPPAVTPLPPADEPEGDRRDRLKLWLIGLTVVAVVAAAAAGYAISEIESTKDENREDNRAVGALRADLDVVREQLTARTDELESQVANAADRDTLRKLEDDLDALDKRVAKLDKQDDGGESDDITTRVDDLEQRADDLEPRVEDLENDSSSN